MGGETLIRITAPHFSGGLVVLAGRVREAAPILKYMIGWPRGQAEAYARRQGWTVEHLGERRAR